MLSRYLLPVGFCILLFPLAVAAQSPAAKPGTLLPTHADYAYGTDSERQKLDFWQASADHPTPVVMLIHGGGWIMGDKKTYDEPHITPYLKSGISVARINYRYLGESERHGLVPPIKGCYYDAARALQTLRANAREWQIDPQRVAVTGQSAGATTALWLALHDDLANPDSDDPIDRHSTRVQCAVGGTAQTTLDPAQMDQWFPGLRYGYNAFGFGQGSKRNRAKKDGFELFLKSRTKMLSEIQNFSPYDLVTPDDPPILLSYQYPYPTPAGQKETDALHSTLFGVKLQEKLEAAGVTCVLNYPGHMDPKFSRSLEFMKLHLRMK